MFGNSFKKLKGSWVGWALIFVCLLSAQASFAASVDVTNQVEVSRSGFVLNRSTGTFDAVVTVKNTGSALVAPVRLAVANVTPDSITLVNATGTTDTGLSYVDIPVSGGRLGSGVSAT